MKDKWFKIKMERRMVSPWLFEWRSADSNRWFTMILMLLMGVVFFLFLTTARTSIGWKSRAARKMGQVFVITGRNDEERRWLRLAEEQSPFPAPFKNQLNPSIDSCVASQRGKASEYLPKLRLWHEHEAPRASVEMNMPMSDFLPNRSIAQVKTSDLPENEHRRIEIKLLDALNERRVIKMPSVANDETGRINLGFQTLSLIRIDAFGQVQEIVPLVGNSSAQESPWISWVKQIQYETSTEDSWQTIYLEWERKVN